MQWFNLCKCEFKAEASQPPSPLTTEQKWLWHLYSNRLMRNIVIPFSPIKITGSELERSVLKLIERYPALALICTESGGNLAKKFLSSFQLHCRVFHLDESLNDGALIHRFASFELEPEIGPLFRVDLVPVRNQEFRLLLTLHPFLATEIDLIHLKEDFHALLHKQPLGASSESNGNDKPFQPSKGKTGEDAQHWTRMLSRTHPHHKIWEPIPLHFPSLSMRNLFNP